MSVTRKHVVSMLKRIFIIIIIIFIAFFVGLMVGYGFVNGKDPWRVFSPAFWESIFAHFK